LDKMKNKTYHNVGTVPKSTRKIGLRQMEHIIGHLLQTLGNG